jgi:hypothetical protein
LGPVKGDRSIVNLTALAHRPQRFRGNDRLFEHGSLETTEVVRRPDGMVSSWGFENH